MRSTIIRIVLLVSIVVAAGIAAYFAEPAVKKQAIESCLESGGTFNIEDGSCTPAPASPKPSGGGSPQAPAPGTPGSSDDPAPAPTYPEVISSSTMIQITSPASNTTVSSPLAISGMARGYWFFEAEFPIELQNANGKVIGRAQARAMNEWMTEDMVPFSATLTFPRQLTGSKGYLVFRKDNPSGLPEHDRSVEVEVTFR